MRATEPERWSHALRPERLYALTECTGRRAEQGALFSRERVDSCCASLDEVDGSGLPRMVGNRKLGSGWRGLVLILVLRRAPWQPAGGGSGGKLDSWEPGRAADGGIEDGLVRRGVEDERVGADDSGRRITGVGAGLGLGRSVGMAAACRKGFEKLRMAGPRLSLTPSPEVTASGDKEAENNHGQHGRDTGGDTRPV